MDAEFVEKTRARLMILEALVVMSVASPYVEKAQKTPGFDAQRAMQREVRRWFDTLTDMPGYNPAILDAEASQMMGVLVEHVAVRLAR